MFIYRSSAFILRVIFGGRAGKSADLKFKCIQLSSPQPTNPSPTLFTGSALQPSSLVHLFTLFSQGGGSFIRKTNTTNSNTKKYNYKSPYLLPQSNALTGASNLFLQEMPGCQCAAALLLYKYNLLSLCRLLSLLLRDIWDLVIVLVKLRVCCGLKR